MSVAWVGAGIAAVGAISSYSSGSKQGEAMDNANALSGEQVALSREQLDWEKKKYSDEQPLRDSAEKRTQQVSDASLAGMNYAMQQAKDAEEYNKTTYRPLEQRLVSEAQTYDTAERRGQEASSAVSEVNRQVGAQRLAASQDLARAGVAPDSMKMASVMEAGNIGAAKAAAGADYTARKNVEQQGYARMSDAAALGRNLPSQQATQQQISTSAGNSSVGAALSGLSASQVGADGVRSGYASGVNGIATGINTQVSMAGLFGKNAANDAGTVGAGMKLFGQYYKGG
ncbi:MAG: hypothetical protein IV107_16285 [Paucibacter sp.]|nr:hypothetical protein [Roseateles sp.]